ncbi:hypothetical protein [Ferrovibrio sp.]|uniref:hypothetical protein n=1 Tax=Ferrovibrio sp. TaxID=1917215 RepID=UPI000CB35998|nr:hypothetical protein [Ferrovibrio sp.]PJI43564.1 MAG: hypothetical protein CTR53_04735 [Ferrovibrio sp.]
MPYQTPIEKPTRAKWIAAGGGGLPAAPLSGPIPCRGDVAHAIANDNAQRCRRSGVAIDPMFLD